MFETVAPELTGRRNRLRQYRSLPLSVAIHGLIVGGLMAYAIASVEFPTEPPALVASYVLTAAPPPPPPPPPPPKASAPTPTPEVRPVENVAPTMIPDMIPLVPDATPSSDGEGSDEGVEGGIPGGEVGGVVGGVMGGVLTPEPPKVVDDGRLHVERNKPLPVDTVDQPFPAYPEKMRVKGIEGMVTIRYIIGKDGKVKEVTILDRDPEEAFNKAVLSVVPKWRFAPPKRNGEPVEIVHEVTVLFELTNR